jgi:hypothetical protein
VHEGAAPSTVHPLVQRHLEAANMTELAYKELITDIAHELIAQIAPQELPLFRPTSEAFINNLGNGLTRRDTTDDMLGFGLDTAIDFLTPVVLALTTEVVKFLAEKAKESIKEASGELIAKFIKRMFNRIPSTEEDKSTPLVLSPEELVQLRQLMLETTEQLRLPKEKTTLLVNAIVGRLAVPHN